jgi:triosephosphate isomerase
MTNKLIVANWKMHGNLRLAHDYAWDLQQKLRDHPSHNTLVVCPPDPYLTFMDGRFAGLDPSEGRIFLGGQNCSSQAEGVRTGEVSAMMLRDVGCAYVIIGHSERRQYHQESSQVLQQKLEIALKAGLKPIFCVGESQEERSNNQTKTRLQQQLAVLSELSCQELIIAYEPIWAIGTGVVAQPNDIDEACRFVAEHVKTTYGIAARVLYGGSVNAGNAQEILSLASVGGVLVGGASLKAQDFHQIATAV